MRILDIRKGIGILPLCALLGALLPICSAGPTWYRGCFYLPDLGAPSRVSSQPLYEQSRNWSPVECARKCLDKGFSFAYLHNGNACFCRKYLSKKTSYDNLCNQRCPGDKRFKCGGSKTANVYSTFGPYISSVRVDVKPRTVVRNQDVTVTVSIELAFDSSTRIGIKQFDRTSFRQTDVNLRLDQDIRTRRPKRVAWIKGSRGQVQFTLKSTTEGLKIIDVTVKNTISSLSQRSSFQVGSREPTDLNIWFERLTTHPGCTPSVAGGGLSSPDNMIIVGESVVFHAEVGSGFNLTFNWNFCGEEIKFVTHVENPQCAYSICQRNAKRFAFHNPGICDVDLRVYNEYGSAESTVRINVITPEFRDLTVIALPTKWELKDPEIRFDAPPWELPGVPIHEGLTEGRENFLHGEYPSSPPIDFFPFGDPMPTEQEDEEEEEITENHIPLEKGQYLRLTPVKFEATAFMNSVDDNAEIEIDYGDGHGKQQNIELNPFGHSLGLRKRRSLPGTGGEEETRLQVQEERRLKRGTNSDYMQEIEERGPYAPYPTTGDGKPVEFFSRAGGFSVMDHHDPGDSDSITVSQDDDCMLTINFQHIYEEAGEYNVTVRLLDGARSLFTSVEPAIHVLNGTAELNIRCPGVVELGKSVILSASSITELPDTLTWEIFSRANTVEAWEQDDVITQPGFSFKNTFLSRGFYRVEVTSDEELSSTCYVQVEEPLSGLTLTSPDRYVQNGSNVEVEIQLQAGTSIELELYSDDRKIDASFSSKDKRRWVAQLSVDESRCHQVYVRGRNPVSNLTSDSIEICGEEQITGLRVEMPDLAEPNSKVKATIHLDSGSNVSLEVEFFSLFGRKLGSPKFRILQASSDGVEVRTPRLLEPGKYRVVATARNNVFAKSAACDRVDKLEADASVFIAKLIPNKASISLSRRQISRGKDNQNDDAQDVYVYTAKFGGMVPKLEDGEGILYAWRVSKTSNQGAQNVTAHSTHYSSSPVFAIDLENCSPLLTSPDGVKESTEAPYAEPSKTCDVEVRVMSPTNNATDVFPSLDANMQSEPTLILSQDGVIETGKSCEFDIKCPADLSDMCSVSFSDGTEPMRIPSNADWKTVSHVFTKPGLYEITLTSSTPYTTVGNVLSDTNVMVQERIHTLKFEGTESISYEVNPFGSWRATTGGGSHKIYRWTINHSNGTNLVDRFTREPEWGHYYPDIGEYVVRVVVFNYVSRQVAQKIVQVHPTPWFFTVMTNSSIVGRPSTFIVSTNASTNIVAAKFENSTETKEIDLNCLQPNSTTLNEENKLINTYVISHTYNQTGSYEATFSLLSRSHDDRTKRLYTLKTEVLHKPAPKKLQLSIVKGQAVEHDGQYYIAKTSEIEIQATTNFHSNIFKWEISKVQGFREDLLYYTIQTANSSTSNQKYTLEHQGRYKILATSYPEEVGSFLMLEAEEVISKVWVDKPFSSKDRKFVNYCQLRRRPHANRTSDYRCDSLTLTGHSYGTKVTFQFHIRWRPQVVEDYSAPTDVVEVIEAAPKHKIHGTGNEASIQYQFSEQGVFSITVVASNPLGNMSAEIPPVKELDGPIRPFLFYAQRSVPRVRLEKEYFVALHENTTFELQTQKSRIDVKIRWEMGDGTKLTGRTVSHAYNVPGSKILSVVAENYVHRKKLSANVKVETPIQEVRVQEMPLAYSTARKVLLHAIVKPPNSAWNYMWYLGNNRTENVSYSSTIRHQFEESGMHLVKVIASNKVSSVESEPIEIELLERINAFFVGDNVVYSNREINMSVNLMYGSDVSIKWTINDGPVIAERLNVTRTFESIGVYDVRVNLENAVSELELKERIFVMDIPCKMPEVNITNNYQRAFMVTRSKPIRLEVDVNLKCPFVARVQYDWKVREVSFFNSQETIGADVYLAGADTSNRILEIPARTLSYGNYSFSVNVSVAGRILFKESEVKVNVYPSHLVAKVDGGNVRSVNRSNIITIDASLSYDPDYPDEIDRLDFEWQCFVLNSPSTPCFRKDLEEMPTEPPVPNPVSFSAMRAAEEYINHDESANEVYKAFPTQIHSNSSVLKFPASWLIQTSDIFVFKVEVSATDLFPRYADTSVVLKITRDHTEWVRISCRNCHGDKVVRNVPIQFDAFCGTCKNKTDILYEWSMHEVDDNSASFYKNETSDCAPRDGHGWMSLIGIFGNASDFTNDSKSDPLMASLANQTVNSSVHEDPNFFGNMVPNHLLNEPLPQQGKGMRSPHSPIDGDIEEGKSPVRYSSIRQKDENYDDDDDDDDGIPRRPLRTLRSAPVIAFPSVSDSPIYPVEEDGMDPIPEMDQPDIQNTRDGYGGHRPLGPSPSHDDVEEAEVLSRFSWRNAGPYGSQDYGPTDPWGSYRNGIIPPLPPNEPPIYPNAPPRGDLFRLNTRQSNVPTANHYQDLKHTKLDLKDLTLSGINHKTLILQTNALSEGKTYSVTADLSDKDTGETIGKTSYYFTVLRGPSYGECSVLYRTQGYSIHCAGWKNQQNDNARDKVSRGEMLHFDMSYSLERNGPRRQIYTGVSNEKSFHLPRDDKPAYIHIILRNSDGASTNVCSFLPAGPLENSTSTEQDYLQQVYEQAVPKKGILNRIVSMGNQEEVIALCNVILDTIPDDDALLILANSFETLGIKEARDVVLGVIKALKSIYPTKMKEVRVVVETLTRALSRVKLVSVRAFFEAANLLISCVHAIEGIAENPDDKWGEYIISDEDVLKILITARIQLTKSCLSCEVRIRSSPDLVEVQEAREMLYGNSSTIENLQQISIRNELIEKEREFYKELNNFLLGVARRRHWVLGPLRSVVDGYGFAIQRYNDILKLFDDDIVYFGNSGSWKVGAVFPENVKNGPLRSGITSDYFMTASTLPDVTLSNYDQFFVEERPLSLAVFDENSLEKRFHKLLQSVVIALPPRKSEKVRAISGIITRDRVTTNSFLVQKRPNTTLHLEIILETEQQRSFPVSIAIIKRKNERSSGPPNLDEIVTKRVISRADFQKYHAQNESIIVKFTLRDKDFSQSHGLYQVVFWNEQAMTSRSRHYDADAVQYTLRVWWSDCFYWDDFFMEWRQKGVQVSDESTSTQTLCKTSHLSSFSASFVPVKTDAQDSDIGIAIVHTALRGSITLLVIVTVCVLLVLYVHHRILRPRELETPKSVFRVDYHSPRPKFSEIGRRLRWFFGPDHKSSAVPVILHDNRKSHKQIFEVTVQTCCWPGSGTTSNVSLILYGEDGKYDARELITPKTHNAREARYENGYSENDDYTGVDDELFITGSTQKFIITFPENLGPLWKIIIWHDNGGECRNWNLDFVTIRDVNNGKKWHFPHYGWLTLNRGKRTLSADLRPIYRPPSFYMQIGLKLNSFLCNFSSICSLVASPGYGQLSRSQRAIHLFTIFVSICGLATARYMLEWDIYSHETDLPYIHGVSITWGLLIGLAASIIVLPAQLLIRFSKHDDRISVMIEDVTESMRGSDFLEDFGSYRYASSLNIIKPPNDNVRNVENGPDYQHYQGEEHLPSVEDAVCDWLELKAESERKTGRPIRSDVDKDVRLPEVRSITSPNWHQSTNSLDDEIVRCMMNSSERSSQLVRENVFPTLKKQGEREVQGTYHAGAQDQTASFALSPRLQQDIQSMMQSGSLLADQYDRMGGIYSSVGSTLAMDGPEIVPCEKLEPLKQDLSLPRWCRKFAWCYYALLSICACALTLYGSLTFTRSYDIGPWIECIVFSTIGVILVIEGSMILLLAIITSAYDSVKWFFSNENLSNLLDRAFSTSDVSTVTETTMDVYIDSSTYYPTAGIDTISSQADETILEDARMARELADRERSRYLRHVEPPPAPSTGIEKAIKARKIRKAVGEWASVTFLLILGIVSAAIISNGFEEVNTQSLDIENWLLTTSAFPKTDKYLTEEMYENRNTTSYILKNVKTKEDWSQWFENVFIGSSDSENIESKQATPRSDYLLRDLKKTVFTREKDKIHIRYILIDVPTIKVNFRDELVDPDSIPPKVLSILNVTVDQMNDKSDVLNARMEGDEAFTDSQAYYLYSNSGKESGTFKDAANLRKTLENDRSVVSVKTKFILYNPYANIYSKVAAKTRLSAKFDFQNADESESSTIIKVSSVSLSQATIGDKSSCTAHGAFYLCQMLLLCWVSYRIIRTQVSWTNWSLRRLTASVTHSGNKKFKDFLKENLLYVVLDLAIWLVILHSLMISAVKRSNIENVMPYIYGYKTTRDDQNHDIVFSYIIKCTARLTTTYGLLNFFLIIKVLAIMRKYHNFPRVPAYSKTSKSTVGEIVVVLAIFWTAAMILAGIGFVLFSEERPFRSFITSLMNVVLSSISLGNFPAYPGADFTALRARYGAIITLFFFLTVFVTFRLILKAILIAVYRKRLKKTKSRGKTKDRKSKTGISTKDLALYLWQKLRYFGLCVACILLQRDPGLWGAHPDVEFTSLGIAKSKVLTEREKKKLGYASSNRSQGSTPVKERVEETKSNESKDSYPYRKYRLPSEVWLTEIESQLDELYTRASALADLASKECLEDELAEDKALAQANVQSKEIPLQETSAEVRSPSPTIAAPARKEQIGDKKPGVADDSNRSKESADKEQNARANAEKPPIRRSSEDKSAKVRKFHPRQTQSSVLNKQSMAPTHTERKDSGISTESRNSTPGMQGRRRTPITPINQRRAAAPVAKKIHARRGLVQNVEWTQPTSHETAIGAAQDARKCGWISDDDILDHYSEVSAISSSSFGSSVTPVPPLTQHNLAKHNHHIFSRQTSSATQGTISQGRNVTLADEPSTSTAHYTGPPEPEATLTQKIWKHLSSFKKHVKKEEAPQQVKTKARPLRRSRTAAINIKDIPEITMHNDSDADSDKTGKKSSASTTKMRSVFRIPKLGLGGTQVQIIGAVSSTRSIIKSPRSQLTSLSSRINDAYVKEELETFSIPGTVPSSSRSSSSNLGRRSGSSKSQHNLKSGNNNTSLNKSAPTSEKEDEGDAETGNNILKELKKNSHKC